MIARTVLGVAAALVMSLVLTGSTARADEVTLPKTAADHEALAKRYEEKVAGYHKEAAEHRAMAEAYRKYEEEFRSHPTAQSADAAKMAEHCGAIMKDADSSRLTPRASPSTTACARKSFRENRPTRALPGRAVGGAHALMGPRLARYATITEP